MRDTQLSVWSRVGGTPLKMGILYVTDQQARFSYEPEYCDSGLPGLSLLYPPERYRDQTIVHSEPGSVHPRFRALIPPADENNFQRKLMLTYLKERDIVPATAFEADLALLAYTGHGGIGHVDVFPDDHFAERWYGTLDEGPLVPIGERFGFSLKEMVSWLDADAHMILESLGPTPSVGGAIPKLLVSIPSNGWDDRVGLPTRHPQAGRHDVVLKIERPQTYPGMAALEALTLDIHREAGFEVPRYWHTEIGGLPALAIQRFDRDADNQPTPTESLFSILAAGTRDIRRHYDGTLDRIANVIDLADPVLVSGRNTARLYLFQRVILALLTGNGDLHLENLSLSGSMGEAYFSPVYDPTPMRAYKIHDLLCAVPFGGYGEEDAKDSDAVIAACLHFANRLGLGKPAISEVTSELLTVTRNYPERISAISGLPMENRDRLIEIHLNLYRRIETLI